MNTYFQLLFPLEESNLNLLLICYKRKKKKKSLFILFYVEKKQTYFLHTQNQHVLVSGPIS